jgi:hypothetical protein
MQLAGIEFDWSDGAHPRSASFVELLAELVNQADIASNPAQNRRMNLRVKDAERVCEEAERAIRTILINNDIGWCPREV